MFRRSLVFVFQVVLAALFITGCSTPQLRYTAEEIKSYPADIQERIMREEVSAGMTMQQVRFAWGGPESVRTLDRDAGKAAEEWEYSQRGRCRTRLLFADNKLADIVLPGADRTASGRDSSPGRYTFEEIKDFPPEMQKRIVSEEVVTGMTQQQVRYAWGAPTSASTAQTPSGAASEEWVYSNTVACQTRLHFLGGALVGVINKSAGLFGQ